jgi:hypothetical protein
MRISKVGMRAMNTNGVGLPNLVGTPQEITQAQSIRQAITEDFENFLAEYKPSHVTQVSALREAFNAVVLTQTDARRFIANHDLELLRPRLSRQLLAWVKLHRPEVFPKQTQRPQATEINTREQRTVIDGSTPAIIEVAFQANEPARRRGHVRVWAPPH